MLEKSTCRSETVYWWKLVVEAANWSPFFPPCKNNVYNYFVFSHKEFRTWGKCCFTWSIVQSCRLCWYLWFYTFVDLLPIMYKLSKKKNLKMNSVQILWGFFVCVYKAKNMVHLMEEMPQSLELVPFFPPIFFESALFFFLYLIWKPLVTIQMIIIIVMLLTFIGCSTVF